MAAQAGNYADHREDVTWADELARSTPAALARFERELVPDIRAVLRGRGFDSEEITEVLQELRVHLLVGDGGPPLITQYGGRGTLRSWVLVCAVRGAVKLRRRQRHEPPAADEVLIDLVDRTAGQGDRDLAALKQGYRDAFRRAFRHALGALDPGSRTLLRLHAIDGLTIDEIGALQGVHRATAARRLERARDSLFRGTRAALMGELGTDRLEAESILRWVRSRIDLSFGGLETAAAAGRAG